MDDLPVYRAGDKKIDTKKSQQQPSIACGWNLFCLPSVQLPNWNEMKFRALTRLARGGVQSSKLSKKAVGEIGDASSRIYNSFLQCCA